MGVAAETLRCRARRSLDLFLTSPASGHPDYRKPGMHDLSVLSKSPETFREAEYIAETVDYSVQRSRAMVADLSIALIKRMSTPGTIASRKPCLPALHPRLLEIVASKLILDWSP